MKLSNLNFLFLNVFLLGACIPFLSKVPKKDIEVTSNNLQYLINQATERKTTLNLSPEIEYVVDTHLNITCSIEGNGAKIVPKSTRLVTVKISQNKIFLKNLSIESEDLKLVNVLGDNITLEKCTLKNSKYVYLLIISGNSLTLENCTLNNSYYKTQSFAIYSSGNKSITGLNVTDCKIKGGIRINNSIDDYSGNFQFINNEITVDYSLLEQDFKNQNDAVRLAGIEDVIFLNNKFNFKNVNRGFKFTDYQVNDKNKKISKRPTTRIMLRKNQIISESSNGKQLFDLYDGSGIIDIKDNEIKSKGHTVIFEDKSTFKQNSDRHVSIISNNIYYDFRLIYYRGVIGQNVILTVTNNNFYYDAIDLKENISRTGNKELNDFELKYLIFGRDLSNLTISNNKFYNEKIYDKNQSVFYSLKIYRVKNADVFKNDIIGGIIYTYNKGDQLLFENNNILNNFNKSFIKYTSDSQHTEVVKDFQSINQRVKKHH